MKTMIKGKYIISLGFEQGLGFDLRNSFSNVSSTVIV